MLPVSGKFGRGSSASSSNCSWSHASSHCHRSPLPLPPFQTYAEPCSLDEVAPCAGCPMTRFRSCGLTPVHRIRPTDQACTPDQACRPACRAGKVEPRCCVQINLHLRFRKAVSKDPRFEFSDSCSNWVSRALSALGLFHQPFHHRCHFSSRALTTLALPPRRPV